MKIEIPGYGPVDIEDLKDDVRASVKNHFSRCFAFTPETVQGLIKKIEELQSDISALESELDMAWDGQPKV